MARLGMVPATNKVTVKVDAEAPALPALPERYVVRRNPRPLPRMARRGERSLRFLPGFN